METITKSAKETKALGRKLTASLIEKCKDTSVVIALIGDLGAGKTTFTQGFAEGLGIKDRVLSPTFILMRTYDNFYHVDLYRLEGGVEKEVVNLGLTDIWKEPGNLILIEWAEKIGKILPKGTIKIKFEKVGDLERKITIKE